MMRCADGRVEIIVGDCRETLRTLPDASVHCCVTSPPYFGLRDYGTATWEGGDPDCDHVERTAGSVSKANGLGKIPGYRDSLPADNAAFKAIERQFRSVCGKCGAKRTDSQIGLEPTPDAYVAEMVAVFREVRRVLRDDGTCWLNIGDSYSTHAAGKVADPMAKSTLAGVRTQEVANASSRAQGAYRKDASLPEKNLMGIPWRVAFALQSDGWVLRQEIIWHKPNPMPESVRDRCTKAHESVFLLSKSPRYYFDAKAIAEPAEYPQMRHQSQKVSAEQAAAFHGNAPSNLGRCGTKDDGTRNRRSVWTIATQPYSGAHFATMPPKLAEDCIKAGCPKGGTVLDPFGGAGTTGLVAARHGRRAILCELNEEYADLARRRIAAEWREPVEADAPADHGPLFTRGERAADALVRRR